MAILTNNQFIEECKRMAGANGNIEKTINNITYYKERFGYVLSGQGEIYSKELAEKWGNAKRANKSKSYFVNTCKHWFGRRVVDCSGMIVEAFRAVEPKFGDKTADYFYNSYCTERGNIKTLPELQGVVVWKKGHIGVYIGGGLVIEARGYKYGVVVSELSTQNWVNWGKLKDVLYTEQPKAKPIFNRLLKYNKNMMRGNDVQALQTLLTAAGQAPGAADGIFGKKTLSAVKSFQRAKKLTVDGIAGENTITALGGKWEKPTAVSWTVSRLLKYKKPMMKGDDVKNLQKALDHEGYAVGSIDGIFGTRTRDAVKAFQKIKKLTVDGIAGKNTITALGGRWG